MRDQGNWMPNTTEESLSPSQFEKELLAGARFRKIRFETPKLGGSGFGHFVVEYESPKRVRLRRR